MKIITNHLAVRQLQDFKAYTVRNDSVELVMIPELGARIISLKDLRAGREWLWHPGSTLQLFRNNLFDDFSRGPLAGIDECLPTIAPCVWRGRPLPDHGEVWTQPWQVDDDDWRGGLLTATVNTPVMPFVFRRSIELVDNEVRLDYELSNLSASPQHFVWAIHPLLRLVDGDALELPDSTRQLVERNVFAGGLNSALAEGSCAKFYATPLAEGRVAIQNETKGERLEFNWNSDENNSLGLWLTRGGWHGHHHFAIEPTNASNDSLAIAATAGRCAVVPGNGIISWQLKIQLGR